ncbi:MAG: hypothetical protein PWP23_2120 [Candidatus Sumerlaeota bacterium]|nr:hypothetical protein [Candidatus Sumerlaeota bacterium]
MKNFLRVCTLQYYLRPVQKFEQFEDQVQALIETASDYKCRLIVFPEYFTVQLLTLGDVKRPMPEQIRYLARSRERYIDMLSRLSKRFGIYVAGGTIPVLDEKDPEKVYNLCHFFNPKGEFQVQGKMHMTRFEKEEWFVSPTDKLRIFDTDFGKVAVTICYDVEFPEIARAAARQGVHILIVPSCTDDRQGYLRVRYCGHARAIENQLYVIISGTVGSLPMVPAVHLNYSQAAILNPSDYQFARDGVLAEGPATIETAVIGELDLESIERNRTWGSVLPLLDSTRTKDLVADPEIVTL